VLGDSQSHSHVLGLLAIAMVLATASTAGAVPVPDDEITVKDTTLKGRVLGLEKAGIRFRTIYGKGTIIISYTDVQKLKVHGEYHILHGDEQEVEGQIVGVEDGRLLVGDDPATAEQVASATIRKGVSKSEYEEESWINRLRTRYPYWRASLDLGLNFEEGAVAMVIPVSCVPLLRGRQYPRKVQRVSSYGDLSLGRVLIGTGVC